MPVKKWFRRIQPMSLYIVLVVSIVFFSLEMVVSHITHSLTLLMDSYHMICNIIALIGCIITVKQGRPKTLREEVKEDSKTNGSKISTISETTEDLKQSHCQFTKEPTASVTKTNQENKLKNTFGWARLDIIFMLICCVFLASLSFSVVVEAVQTLVHIDHQDEMHRPIFVLCIGSAGILVNGLCYLLIGGYTFHQGSFLYVTDDGNVILDKVVTNESVSKGERRLSRTRNMTPGKPRNRENAKEMIRDVIGCIFVIITSFLVYFTKAEVAKYIDPILSIFSSIILMILSYPFMKESCLILLQTIPGSMNINSMRRELLNKFPDILNVHDFHVWQLTMDKVILTVHIIFQDPKVYANVINEINEFFLEQGITQLTIQPEFFQKSTNLSNIRDKANVRFCLMKCKSDSCITGYCCPDEVVKNLNAEKSKSTNVADLSSIKIEDSNLFKVASKNDLNCDSSETEIEKEVAVVEGEQNEDDKIAE